MRYTTRAMLGVLLIFVTGATGLAEETKSSWWRFGKSETAPEPADAFTPAPTLVPSTSTAAADSAPASEASWLAWPSLPKFGWQDFKSDNEIAETSASPVVSSPLATLRRGQRGPFGKPHHQSRPRNTWAQQPASATSEIAGNSPWKSMTESTRNAWHKTVDFVTPGDSSDEPVVRREPVDSWWSRMWGSEQKQEGPQTVTEWMAQDRLDP